MLRNIECKIVDVNKLSPNPSQPREKFDEENLSELAVSLKSRGDIQPIIVREHERGYQIIAGERRWRAAKLAGMKEVPVLVRATAEEDVLLESLIENLHRQDLKSHERENAVYALWKTDRWKTYEELGKTLGKTYKWVSSNVEAASIRKKERIPVEVSTRTISSTVGLEREERRQIIEKVRKEEIPEKEVREYARVVKKATKPVKKALLKPKSRLTPKMAQKLLELPEPKQVRAVKQIEALRLEEDEAISHVEAMKVEVPLPPPEEIGKVRVRYEELQKEIKAKLETPEAIERGDLFRNWTSHIAVAGIFDSISCPICKSKKLGWMCHNLTIQDALSTAEKKYKEDITNSSRGG